MPTSNEEAQVVAADRLRDVMHAIMGHEQEAKVLLELAAELERRVPGLTAGQRIDRSVADWADGKTESFIPASGEYFEHDLRRPFSGMANPFSVPYQVLRNEDRTEAVVTLRPAFEGAPKRSHGGVVAAIFDDLAGYLLSMERRMAFTAWIRIDYRAPTPIGEPIVYGCWVDRIEDRKLFFKGDCFAEDGTLIATCDGLFVTPRAI